MPTDVAVCIDCNGTLVHVKLLSGPGTGLPGLREFERGGDWFQVIVRPSAAAFIERLTDLSIPVYVITSGSTKIQSFILNVAELAREVNGVYGVGTWQDVELPARWVHVDDSPCSAVEDKLQALARGAAVDKHFLERHFIQCAGFTGTTDDAPLTDLLPAVLAKLGLDENGKDLPSTAAGKTK